MSILFITGLYPNEYINQLNILSNGKIQNAPNVFQWGIVEGLYKNNIDFNVVSLPFLPAYPLNYKKVKTLNGDITFNGEKIGDMLSYCNLLGYKTHSMQTVLYKYPPNKAGENFIVPETVKVIKDRAFGNAINLKSIVFLKELIYNL